MADNITAPGAGSVLATEDIAGVHYPKSIVVDGTGAEIPLATQTTLASVLTSVDGLEALTTAANALLTTQNGYLDGVETALSTLNGYVDTLETLTSAMSAKLPSALVGGSLSVALGQAEYETVAASASDQMLGATGAVGDYLAEVLIIPGSTSPGAVSIKDGNGSAITIFAGGASSVSNLVPFAVPLGIRCTAATTPGWKITTGANVTAIGVGDFT